MQMNQYQQPAMAMAGNPAQVQANMQPGGGFVNMPQYFVPQWQTPYGMPMGNMPMMMPQTYQMQPMFAPMPYSQAVATQGPANMPLQAVPQITAGPGGYVTPQPTYPVGATPQPSTPVRNLTSVSVPVASTVPTTMVSIVGGPPPIPLVDKFIAGGPPPIPPRKVPVSLSETPVTPAQQPAGKAKVDETVTEQVKRDHGATPEYQQYRHPSASVFIPDNTINMMYNQVCGGMYSMMAPPDGAVGGMGVQVSQQMPQQQTASLASTTESTRTHSVHSTPITSANGGRPLLGRNHTHSPMVPATCAGTAPATTVTTLPAGGHFRQVTTVGIAPQAGPPMNSSAGVGTYPQYFNPAHYMTMPPPAVIPKPHDDDSRSFTSDRPKPFKNKIPHAIWPKFDGTRKWGTFFKKWEAVAKQQCIAAEDKVGCLIMCIKKDAEDYMGTFSESVLSDFDKLTKAFERGYGVTDNYREITDQLSVAKQGKMTVNEFAIHVSSLANRLELGSDEDTERMAGEAFLRGANDINCVGMVKFAYGITYPKGIPLEVALSNYKRAIGDSASNSTDPQVQVKTVENSPGTNPGREASPNRQGSSQNDYPGRSRSRDRKWDRKSGFGRSPSPNRQNDHMAYKELQKEMNHLKDKMALLMSSTKNDAKKSESPTRNFFKPKTCYKCGKPGHFAQNCKDGETKPNTCLACKQDHKTEKCPKLQQIRALQAEVDMEAINIEVEASEGQESENC